MDQRETLETRENRVFAEQWDFKDWQDNPETGENQA